MTEHLKEHEYERDTPHGAFLDAEQALVWSVELLRRRRLPKLTLLWREILPEAEFVAKAWTPNHDFLPADPDERWGLALKVESALVELAARHAEAALLLRLWAWGDWADEARLAGALAMQEKLRRQGMRVRIAYRYTYAQLGILLKCDRKAAWRKVQEALLLLEGVLAVRGLLAAGPGAAGCDEEGGSLKKNIHHTDFKNV